MKEITKGEVVEITKETPGLKNVLVGLGWDVNDAGGAAYDLDASALVLTDGKLQTNTDAVFFQNKTSTDGAVVHSGDNLTGEGDGDDEQINIDLSKVSGNQVDIVLTLYQAAARNQDMSKIQNAYIRLVNADGNVELAKFPVTGAQVKGASLLFASLLKGADGNWSFKAQGSEITGEITQVLHSYGYAQAA